MEQKILPTKSRLRLSRGKDLSAVQPALLRPEYTVLNFRYMIGEERLIRGRLTYASGTALLPLYSCPGRCCSCGGGWRLDPRRTQDSGAARTGTPFAHQRDR